MSDQVTNFDVWENEGLIHIIYVDNLGIKYHVAMTRKSAGSFLKQLKENLYN